MAGRSTGCASRTVDRAGQRRTDVAPQDMANLGNCLRVLARRATTVQAELLDALARFDEAEGWRVDGAKNCVRWMCSEMGVGRSLAYCQLHAARKLRELPILAALFREGELSWSKIQSLTRIATPEDERALAIMALDLDANAVQQICDDYRWGRSDSSAQDDAERDRQRFERRSLTWSRLPDGSLVVRTVLPPDMAANFLSCLEHRESLEFAHENDPGADGTTNLSQRTGPQRRADAVVAMAEAGLSAAGDNVSSADRFQVVVHVDADALDACCKTPVESSGDLDDSQPDAPLPLPVRAAIAGIGGISPSTARRLACDGSLVTMIMRNGEPISVGRKTRRWSPAIRRAVMARDGGCTFPGCGATRNLDIHHVEGWALGGETSVATGTTLCRSCHTRVHDEGWHIRRVDEGVPPHRHPKAD